MESLSKLKPVLLNEDPDATVTAGNASGQNDAASMCVVTTPEKAAEFGPDAVGPPGVVGRCGRCART